MMLQLSQAKIFPAEHRLNNPRYEGAGRHHERWIESKINGDFDPVSAGTYTDCAALPVRRKQNNRDWHNVRQQIRQLRRIFNFRSPNVWKGKIIMCAEALKLTPAFVPFAPMIQFHSKAADLFPQQTRCAITAARLEFNNWCRDFDHPGVEINCTTCGQLKRFTGARDHATPN
jgi:hypothetical protein